jgi:hypothetical protein
MHGLPPPCRLLVVSDWGRALRRVGHEPITVVLTDRQTFIANPEETRAALAELGAQHVLVVGLPRLPGWAHELGCEASDPLTYGRRAAELCRLARVTTTTASA